MKLASSEVAPGDEGSNWSSVVVVAFVERTLESRYKSETKSEVIPAEGFQSVELIPAGAAVVNSSMGVYAFPVLGVNDFNDNHAYDETAHWPLLFPQRDRLRW